MVQADVMTRHWKISHRPGSALRGLGLDGTENRGVVACADGTAAIWELATGAPVGSLDREMLTEALLACPLPPLL